MGNCQTADAAATVIQHADGRLETAYWPLAADQVMAAHPGHYVAAIITVDRRGSSGTGAACKPVRYLKLLSPEDALLAGHFYRLVSFEDVLREFGSKRRVRLSKLMAKKKDEMRIQRGEEGEAEADSSSSSSLSLVEEMEEEEHDSEGRGIRVSRHGQWRPSLQTIAEAGSFKLSTLS